MFKLSLTYGIVIGIAGTVLNFVLYLAGMHNDLERLPTAQLVGGLLGFVIMVVGVALAIKAARAVAPEGKIGYGRAVGIGVLTCTLAGAIGAPLTYVYGGIINPELHQLIYELQVSKLSEQMTAAQIEQAAPMMKFFTGPVWMAGAQFVFSPLIGLILSLIVALFFRKPAPNWTPPVPPQA